MIRFFIGAVLAKGIVMGIAVYGIVTSHLSVFTKTVILTAISATVTGLFTVAAAILAARIAANAAKQLQEDVGDVKRHLDLTKRASDQEAQ